MSQGNRRNPLASGASSIRVRLLISSLVALMLFAPLGIPIVSDTTGGRAAACSGANLIRYSDGSWGKSVITPTGLVIGSVKNWSTGSCTGQWYTQFLLTNSNYVYTLHTWRPNAPAYVTYAAVPNVWYYTKLLTKGGQYCNGVNIYYKSGGQLLGPRWQFLGCFYT